MSDLVGWNELQKIEITIDETNIDSDLTDFPVKIFLDTSGSGDLDWTPVFTQLNTFSQRKKIALTADDGVTEIYVEIEYWNDVGSTAVLWFKAPNLYNNPTGDQNKFYLYYDNTHDDNTTYIGDTGDVAAQNVWDSNYLAVWHMAQDPSDGLNSILDSTSNAYHGTPEGTMDTSNLVNGLGGSKALDFSGDDNIDFGNILDSFGTSPFTIENSFKTSTSGNQVLIGKYSSAGSSLGYHLKLESSILSLFTADSGPILRSLVGTTSLNDNAWHNTAVTRVTTTGQFYVDGSTDITTGVIATDQISTSHPFTISVAERSTGEKLWYFTGLQGEIRISDINRSVEWLKATNYSNSNTIISLAFVMPLPPVTITPGSPFDGFFRLHLPQFFFDKWTGNDKVRIETMVEKFEIIFDQIYQKVKSFPDELDVTTAEAKYLFQLGKLLGIQDIDDLSIYLDDDGNVHTITQLQFDNTITSQRSYIANTIGRYLLKGSIESIVRLLYSKGLDTEIREMWTENTITGPYFEYDNPLVTMYGDAIIGDISGDIYNEEEFDIITEMSGDVPAITAANDIIQYESNYYGYQYVLDDNNKLYYKTSDSPDVELTINTWYEFNTSILTVAGSIGSFHLLGNKIYILTTANDLEVFDYNLDSSTLTSAFNIDNNNLFFLKFIENGTRVLFDRGTTIEIRNTSTFQKISASVSKPAGHVQTIFNVVKKKHQEYFILNNNSNGYILSITPDFYDIFGAPDTYNLLIDLVNETKYDIFRIDDDLLLIVKFNTLTGDVKISSIFFDNNNGMTLSTSNLANINVTSINDIYKYSSQIIIMDDNYFAIYHVIDKTYDEYSYINGSGKDYKELFFLDKFYLKRFDVGSNLTMSKVIGWNSFKDELYKSHYFDILVSIGSIENLDISIEIDSLATFVDDIIDTVKPAHAELLNVLTILTSITENTFTNDDASSEAAGAGGSEYIISVLAKYDGIHPWKRINNHPITYDNDGVNNGVLKYGYYPFSFDMTWTDAELDAYIYTNVTP